MVSVGYYPMTAKRAEWKKGDIQLIQCTTWTLNTKFTASNKSIE